MSEAGKIQRFDLYELRCPTCTDQTSETQIVRDSLEAAESEFRMIGWVQRGKLWICEHCVWLEEAGDE